MNEDIHFRMMTVNDIEEVLEIERLSYAKPWSRKTFYYELTSNPYATYLLMFVDGQIAGYCGVWVVFDEAQITNIAVHPAFRGKKLGEALMKKSMEIAKKLGAISMSLEVRTSNRIAQNLYRKFGFQKGGIRKNYYTDNGEDAYVMWVKFYEPDRSKHIGN